ncbi:aromatic ring-hydroxylating oxygenase subunit alpha [Propylenella binzhouense]|uniref:Aromatic ring-hydroxylating dioxygenase subunit alpha n=1 Tax=Propylenella binzhouense TaxID=2555902 RepID=A0A964T8D5_9HYPH|nr:aromatic ring-hydroxylating dioxygenase subunit alpha [Propylenella binzhouense]MYZ50349.1 aromatic ring-hydroxylating dioxygenase subunit alpha [Propylenella binzhouense]
MQGLTADILKGCWYLALESGALGPAKPVGLKIAGEPIVLARGADGTPFALRDSCPHRGIPLHYGRVKEGTIECCYHGWRFGADGGCVEIPSLREGQAMELSRIRTPAFPTRERYGCIWIYLPRGEEAPAEALIPEPVGLPDLAASEAPKSAIAMDFPCSSDHAAFGLMDPTHAAYVHTSWWFKKDARKLRPKEKRFAPSPFGFRMERHAIPPQNVIYRWLLGDNVTTEIGYQLPGYRIEHIRGDRHWVVGLTAITPIDEGATVVHQLFWTSLGWVRPAAPLVRHFTRVFLRQDRDVVVQQREGLAGGAKVMLINDADTQARWWMRLKHEWQVAQAEGRAFVNPLRPQILRFRS